MPENQRLERAGSYPVIFFDGECPLCHSTVAFLLRRDAQGRLRFAPLQGELAQTLLPQKLRDIGTEATVVLREPDGTIQLRAAGVATALRSLSLPWRFVGWLGTRSILVPVLNILYRVIARRRDAWFGRYEQCPLPPPHWRDRFLP